MGTHSTCAQLHLACSAIDLVSEALDVVERVHNEDGVRGQLALDGGEERPPRRFFELALCANEWALRCKLNGTCTVIACTGQAEGVVGDDGNLLNGPLVGVCADELVEVCGELACAGRLAGGGEA
jgi:hypothetical protein